MAILGQIVQRTQILRQTGDRGLRKIREVRNTAVRHLATPAGPHRGAVVAGSGEGIFVAVLTHGAPCQ